MISSFSGEAAKFNEKAAEDLARLDERMVALEKYTIPWAQKVKEISELDHKTANLERLLRALNDAETADMADGLMNPEVQYNMMEAFFSGEVFIIIIYAHARKDGSLQRQPPPQT